MGHSNDVIYNRAKTWQIGFFAANNMATNLYSALTMYISYFACGVIGLAVSTVAVLLTSMRVFDGITDPLIGAWIDRTDGKLGKFRPFMIFGNLIMLSAMTSIFYITGRFSSTGMRLACFIACYVLYIIGYTMQTAVTKAGQTALTNDPKQRPLFALFDSFLVMAVFGSIPIYVSTVLAKKYGTIGNPELFGELVPKILTLSAVCTVIAVIGIWKKDRKEFYGAGTEEKVSVKDYVDVIKHNRAIQMLIVAACSDKLALGVAGNTTVGVMLYGILFGNYSISGLMSMAGMAGGVVITIFGVRKAQKMGLRRAHIAFTKIALTCFSVLAVILLIGGEGMMQGGKGLFLVFVAIYVLGYGAYMVAGNISIPMIADCSDYETYRTGKYIPGMMGTLFSFVDKIITSLSATIVGFSVILAGYSSLPDIDTPYSPVLKYLTIALFCGLPIIGWILSLIAMKFYPLTSEMMEEVQKKIASEKKI